MIKIDRHTVIQVLGGLMHQPSFLSEVDRYMFEVNDFPNTLDRFVFSAINNLYNSGDGARVIRAIDVINYLKSNEVANSLLEKENAEGFLQDCEATGEPENFNYYYTKLKKLNFIKDLQKTGRDTNNLYCENLIDSHYSEINERFEHMTLQDLVNQLRIEVGRMEQKYVLNGSIKKGNAAEGVRDLVSALRQKPDFGAPPQGERYSTICRGLRLGKFYLRCAASGVGKTRRMVGDACYLAYPCRFDTKSNKWVSTGPCHHVAYIMTEQSIDEIQPMILAYLTGYNEDMFKNGLFGEEEMPRIEKAIEIMEAYSGNFEMIEVPDPCGEVMKTLIRQYAIEHGVTHFFYDYIFSCPALLNEYRDIGVREDVALRLFTTTLKNLCKELNIFMMSATQLTLTNEEAAKGGFKDERCIRGSKAINDLSDCSSIMSRPTQEELTLLAGYIKNFSFAPTLVTDVFKNRGGRWNRVRIWSYYDAGTLRTEDLFITTPEMKPIENFKVIAQIVDLEFDKDIDFINSLNEGDNGVDTGMIDMCEVADAPEDLMTDMAEAFNDSDDKRKRVHEKSFADFL